MFLYRLILDGKPTLHTVTAKDWMDALAKLASAHESIRYLMLDRSRNVEITFEKIDRVTAEDWVN